MILPVRTQKILLALIAMIFFSGSRLQSKDSPADVRGILHFADSLAAESDYYRAITEYKRALFFFPEYEKRNWIQFEIGRMYFFGGRYNAAKKYFVPLTATPDPQLKSQVSHWLALTYYENKDFVDARRAFSELKKGQTKNKLDYEIYELMTIVNQKQFDQAFAFENKLEQKYPVLSDPLYSPFFKAGSNTLKRARGLQRKSPGWAVFWGILLPGGGHLYLKEWDNALISFLLVGSMGLLAADGFIQENAVQAGIFTTIGTGFYAGSIYSAYRQTKKHNRFLGDAEVAQMNKNFSRLNFAIRRKLEFQR